MIITDMYDALRHGGIDVYFAGQADGAVTSTRAVLTDAGVEAMGKTVGRHVIYVTVYVPLGQSVSATGEIARVRSILAQVPSVRATGAMSEGDVLDEIRAYALSAEYYAMCAL